MNAEIEMIPSYHIAYIRNVGPYGNRNKDTMEQLKEWARKSDLFYDNSIILGIAQDDPGKTKSENCRYDTGLVVSTNYIIDDDFVQLGKIVGGKYCVFKIEHTAEAVKKAWSEVFTEVERRSQNFDNTRPILERYIVKLVNNHYCEICIPIE